MRARLRLKPPRPRLPRLLPALRRGRGKASELLDEATPLVDRSREAAASMAGAIDRGSAKRSRRRSGAVVVLLLLVAAGVALWLMWRRRDDEYARLINDPDVPDATPTPMPDPGPAHTVDRDTAPTPATAPRQAEYQRTPITAVIPASAVPSRLVDTVRAEHTPVVETEAPPTVTPPSAQASTTDEPAASASIAAAPAASPPSFTMPPPRDRFTGSTEAPPAEAPSVEAPSVEAPSVEAPSVEAPSPDVSPAPTPSPGPQAVETDAIASDAGTTEDATPTSDAPSFATPSKATSPITYEAPAVEAHEAPSVAASTDRTEDAPAYESPLATAATTPAVPSESDVAAAPTEGATAEPEAAATVDPVEAVTVDEAPASEPFAAFDAEDATSVAAVETPDPEVLETAPPMTGEAWTSSPMVTPEETETPDTTEAASDGAVVESTPAAFNELTADGDTVVIETFAPVLQQSAPESPAVEPLTSELVEEPALELVDDAAEIPSPSSLLEEAIDDLVARTPGLGESNAAEPDVEFTLEAEAATDDLPAAESDPVIAAERQETDAVAAEEPAEPVAPSAGQASRADRLDQVLLASVPGNAVVPPSSAEEPAGQASGPVEVEVGAVTGWAPSRPMDVNETLAAIKQEAAAAAEANEEQDEDDEEEPASNEIPPWPGTAEAEEERSPLTASEAPSAPPPPDRTNSRPNQGRSGPPSNPNGTPFRTSGDQLPAGRSWPTLPR